MGTGKKKIQMEKITKGKSRMVTFSKRRKGLFKKYEELESMTGSHVASVVFSPNGKPYTYGDVNSAIKRHFPSLKLSTSEMNSHQTNSDVVGHVFSGRASGLRSSSTPRRNGLRDWVEGIDVERCQNLNQLLLLKEQLEGTREKIVSIEDAESFEAMFM